MVIFTMNRRRAGFTLVEVVVALALMSVVMVMVTTTFLLITNYTGKESGFFETINDLNTAQRRISAFLDDNDRAGNELSVTENGICAFNSTGDLVVGDFAFSSVNANFSRMEVYNTVYCELRLVADSSIKHQFDALIINRQPWADGYEERALNSVKNLEFENYTFSVSDNCLWAENGEHRERILAPDNGISLRLEDNSLILQNPAVIGGEYSIPLFLPIELWEARVKVLNWVRDSSLIENVRYSVADAALTVSDGDEARHIAYVSSENAARYQFGFLMSVDDQKNLLLISGEVPSEVETLTGVEFKEVENIGVKCMLTHYMRGAEQTYDFIAQCHAANVG